MSLRKVTKRRGSFPSDEVLLRLFYLALNNISEKWTMPLRDWKAALTRFTFQLEGRMPKDRSQPRLHKTPYILYLPYWSAHGFQPVSLIRHRVKWASYLAGASLGFALGEGFPLSLKRHPPPPVDGGVALHFGFHGRNR
jgi:putative transposase